LPISTTPIRTSLSSTIRKKVCKTVYTVGTSQNYPGTPTTTSQRVTEPTNINTTITPEYVLLKPQKPTLNTSSTENTPLTNITSFRSNHSTPPVKHPTKVSSVRTKQTSVCKIPQRLNSNLTATKRTPLADITSLVLNINTSGERSSLPTSQLTQLNRTPIRTKPRCHASNLHVNLANKFDAVTANSSTICLDDPTNHD
jgi:hypothetical protein